MATYYVATTGLDSRTSTEAQNILTPWRTITKGRQALSNTGGDTLYIRAGTYTTEPQRPLNMASKVGTSTSQILISGYNGEIPVIASTDKAAVVTGTSSWITFRDMIWDGVNDTFGMRDDPVTANTIAFCDHIFFINIEIRNFYNSGLYLDNADDITIQNCRIHGQHDDCSNDHRPYGIYFHDGLRATLQDCEIYNNVGGGMQFYPGPWTGCVVRRNKIYANGSCPGSNVGGVLLLNDGTGGAVTNTQIYNNLIYENVHVETTTVCAGVTVSTGTSGTKVWNNTIVGNQRGVNIQNSGAVNTDVRNNIVYNNVTGVPIINAGTGSTVNPNFTTNPSFVNLAGDDYHLAAGSPAIDTATSVSLSAFFTTDYAGTSRPQGSTWEYGAYEFGGPDITPPATPTGLQVF